MACCECLLIGNARPPLHLTGNAGARRMQGEGTPLCPVRDNKGLLGWRQSLKGQRDKKGRDPSTGHACSPLVAIPKEVLGTEQGGQEILVEDRMAICDIIVSRVE